MASKGLLSVCLEYKGLECKGGAMPLDGYNACRFTLLTIETVCTCITYAQTHNVVNVAVHVEVVLV